MVHLFTPRLRILLPVLALALSATGGYARDMRFTLTAPASHTIIADGVIGRDTYRAFLALRVTHPHLASARPLILLNSTGGNPMGAAKLGAVLRESGALIIIGAVQQGETTPGTGLCTSACVLAFAGGVTRSLAPGSRIGVHAPSRAMPHAEPGHSVYKEMPPLERERFESFFASYYQSMGINPALQRLSAATPHTGMHYLTLDEMRHHRLLTPAREAARQTSNLYQADGLHHAADLHHADLRPGSL